MISYLPINFYAEHIIEKFQEVKQCLLPVFLKNFPPIFYLMSKNVKNAYTRSVIIFPWCWSRTDMLNQ